MARLLCEAPAEEAEAWKIDFNEDGSQILTGQLALKTLKINQDGQMASLTKEGDDLATNQKLIQALAYSRNGQLAATGNIDGVVYLYDMQTRNYKARFASKCLCYHKWLV